MGGGVVGVELSQAYVLARRARHADRGRAPAARARGGVRLRAGHGGARGAGRRHPHRPQGDRRRARRRRGLGHARRRRHGQRATSCSSRSGARPQVEGLGLESVGLEADGYVEVDEHARVPGHDWLYVIGDLNGRAAFTHMAKYQARDRRRPRARQGQRGRARRRRPARAARDLHRPAGRRRRPHDARPREDAGLSPRVDRHPDVGQRRRLVLRPRRARHEPLPRRRGARRARRRDDHRLARSPTSCTPRRSRSSARSRSTRLRHAVPAFPTRSEIWLKLIEELGRLG